MFINRHQHLHGISAGLPHEKVSIRPQVCLQNVQTEPEMRINKDIKMNLPDIYTEQLKKISVEFEKERNEEEEELQLSGRIGKRIQRIRREYSNFSHWSRFGSLPKKTQAKFNPEINSNKKPMTARNKGVEI